MSIFVYFNDTFQCQEGTPFTNVWFTFSNLIRRTSHSFRDDDSVNCQNKFEYDPYLNKTILIDYQFTVEKRQKNVLKSS